jgi:hypothetical protein
MARLPGDNLEATGATASRYILFSGRPEVLMFYNYFGIALRNIVRHKLYSFINIGGLAVSRR